MTGHAKKDRERIRDRLKKKEKTLDERYSPQQGKNKRGPKKGQKQQDTKKPAGPKMGQKNKATWWAGGAEEHK